LQAKLPTRRRSDGLAEKAPNLDGDLVDVRLEREVPGVVELHRAMADHRCRLYCSSEYLWQTSNRATPRFRDDSANPPREERSATLSRIGRATVVFAGQGPEEGHNVVNVTVREQAPGLTASHHANGIGERRGAVVEVGRRQDCERELGT
jgi:hypothetical protein